MRPVRSLALGVLVRVERDGAHATPLIDARGRGLPARDRDLLRALVKRTLRNALLLDHVLSRSLNRPVGELQVTVRAALRLGAAQLLLMDRIPAHAAVGETVDALKEVAPRAAGLVNAVLRRVAAGEERPGRVLLPAEADPLARLALETSHPEWLVRRWAADLGLEAMREALAFDEEDSPIDLLMDPRLGAPEELAERLLRDGIVTEPSPWAPLARTVVSGPAASHPLVASGALAVVDAAAQAVVELATPAAVVADLAAAPGGKTRALLARSLARRVVALERTLSRLARLDANLVAAGRRDEALLLLADARRPPLRKGSFASLLLDAPCSGTGTLRKNPEIRLRLRPSDLAGFAAIQHELLAAALDLMAPGGRLLYVTCSLEPEENEEVASAVLSGRSGYALEAPDASRIPGPLRRWVRPSGLVRVPPGRTNDGFSVITISRARQDR